MKKISCKSLLNDGMVFSVKLLLSLILIILSVHVASATLYDEHTSGVAIAGFNIGEVTLSQCRGTTFTAASSYTGNVLSVQVAKVGSPPDLTFYLYHASGGKPSGAAIASSVTNLSASSVGSKAWYNSTTNDFSISSGSVYSLVVCTADLSYNAANYYQFTYDSSETGQYLCYGADSTCSSTLANKQANFQVYYAAASQSYTFLAIGDSVVAGAYSSFTVDDAVAESLTLNGYDTTTGVNEGINGACMTNTGSCSTRNPTIDRYSSDVVAAAPTWAYVMPNFNDNWLGMDLTDYENDYRTVIQGIKGADIPVISSTMTGHDDSGGATNTWTAAENARMREIAIIERIPFFELHYLMNHSSSYRYDNVHLNDAGTTLLNNTLTDLVLNNDSYTMTPELFNIYHDCDNEISVLNHSISMPSATCGGTTADDWSVILNVTNTTLYIERLDSPVYMNITYLFNSSDSYNVSFTNGTQYFVNSDVSGSINNLLFSVQGTKMSIQQEDVPAVEQVTGYNITYITVNGQATGEQASFKSYLESQGHNVSLADDSWTNLSSSYSATDVFIIGTGTNAYTNLKNELKNERDGVLIFQKDSWENFGMCTDNDQSASYYQLNLTDNDHPVSSWTTIAQHSFFSAAGEYISRCRNSAWSGEETIIGIQQNTVAYAYWIVANSSDRLTDGTQALGRRAIIGWGDSSYDNMTDWGKQAINKTINWLGTSIEGNTQPEILSGSESLTLHDLKNGLENYTIIFNVTDENGESDVDVCYVATNEGNKECTLSEPSMVCTCEFTISQAASVWLIASANDTIGDVGNGTKYDGVSVDYSYDANASATNTLSQQYFIKVYNITSYVGNLSNVSFQGAPGEIVRNVSLTNASTYQDNVTAQNGDYLIEDAAFTISGSEFVADAAYNIVRGVTFNNSLAKSLPRFLLSIPLSKYSGNALAEVQDGVSWPDLNSSISLGTLMFNLSGLAAGSTQNYRYSYDAELVTWNGSLEAVFVDVDGQKNWTYNGTYEINFDMSGKTIKKTIQESSWPYYERRLSSLSKSFINSSGGVVVDSWVDQSGSWLHSFGASGVDAPVLTLSYLTPSNLDGSNTAGGGGGSRTEYVEVTIGHFNGSIDFGGLDFYSITLFSLPKEVYKEFLITAVAGEVHGYVNVSENIAPYILDYGICELDSKNCSRNIDMKEGERKILFFHEYWTDDLIEQFEADDYQVVGQFYAYGDGNEIDWPIIVQTGFFFKESRKLSEAIGGLSHDAASKLIFTLAVIVILVVAAFLINRA